MRDHPSSYYPGYEHLKLFYNFDNQYLFIYCIYLKNIEAERVHFPAFSAKLYYIYAVAAPIFVNEGNICWIIIVVRILHINKFIWGD